MAYIHFRPGNDQLTRSRQKSNLLVERTRVTFGNLITEGETFYAACQQFVDAKVIN